MRASDQRAFSETVSVGPASGLGAQLVAQRVQWGAVWLFS